RLLLAQTAIPFALVEKDTMKGETRTPAFLALNANGRIPVLELDDGRRIAESDAILFYLAEGTPFLPADRFARAEVLQWMFFEQYSHEPYIAVARFWTHYLGKAVDAEQIERGYQARVATGRHVGSRGARADEQHAVADVG